jgi:hypothetical protein
MRTKWFLAICALMVSSQLAAQSGRFCTIGCDNQYNACASGASLSLSNCNSLCDQTYPNNPTARAACRANCQANFQYKLTICHSQWEACLGGCPEDTDSDNCPIVVDLAQPSLRFTAAEGGVLFDIDGDGSLEPLAWTDAGAGDGFLALDRNGNGRIDSGRELFGNHTAQLPSDKPNGFLALAVFDGNGDGVISSDDGIWPALRIWVDANHNGVSEAGELAALSAYAIKAIDLSYHESRRKDGNGNELRYSTQVLRQNAPPTHAVDVFFDRAP